VNEEKLTGQESLISGIDTPGTINPPEIKPPALDAIDRAVNRGRRRRQVPEWNGNPQDPREITGEDHINT